MEIHRAQPGDAATLTEIAFAAKRHWGYPERWIQGWRDVLTVQAESIAANETYYATMDGRTVGFYLLIAGINGHLRLEHLWVLPGDMGHGAGRALFEHAVERARALGGRVIEIESDPNAGGFYERMGARKSSVRITELDGQPRELPLYVFDL